MKQRGYRRTPYNTKFSPQGISLQDLLREADRDVADDESAPSEPPAPQEGRDEDDHDDRQSER